MPPKRLDGLRDGAATCPRRGRRRRRQRLAAGRLDLLGGGVDRARQIRVGLGGLGGEATLAPSRAARSAMARPMPRLAPVMNSVAPLKDLRPCIGVLQRAFVRSGNPRARARRARPGTARGRRRSGRRGPRGVRGPRRPASPSRAKSTRSASAQASTTTRSTRPRRATVFAGRPRRPRRGREQRGRRLVGDLARMSGPSRGAAAPEQPGGRALHDRLDVLGGATCRMVISASSGSSDRASSTQASQVFSTIQTRARIRGPAEPTTEAAVDATRMGGTVSRRAARTRRARAAARRRRSTRRHRRVATEADVGEVGADVDADEHGEDRARAARRHDGEDDERRREVVDEVGDERAERRHRQEGGQRRRRRGRAPRSPSRSRRRSRPAPPRRARARRRAATARPPARAPSGGGRSRSVMATAPAAATHTASTPTKELRPKPSRVSDEHPEGEARHLDGLAPARRRPAERAGEVGRERPGVHEPLDSERDEPGEDHERGEAGERETAGLEGQQVGEVRHGQQERGAVGQMRAGVDVGARARAQARRGREDDRRQQHHRRVEGEHRGDRRGDEEDHRQQPLRVATRSARHQVAPPASNRPARRQPSERTEQGREERDGRRRGPHGVARVAEADGPDGNDERCAGEGRRPSRAPWGSAPPPPRERGEGSEGERRAQRASACKR